MKIKENLKKAANWTAEHSVELIYGGLVLGTIGLSIYVGKKQWEADVAYSKALNDQYNTIAEAVARGASVIPGPNGGYWILEKNQA